ncbi:MULTISPECIES: helix-turn-helix transcriptional regulator [Paraburkholderia]|uniref:helix-turn-helix transcriptional regulator n=1 Tax=Paraburkholderia TaxID=1822464 RepID=UPI0022518A45|nr:MULTISPECIES: transcriptional regulator [Paraburkholderia]MCX4156140.1 transcriptional regulator [Paraburkholderia aspalathi]MDN7165546.1 transcriptional regulator [Paraburkholderia sp. SECH2]MDQ6394032.1 transcriptional regulator [Paraburkholderia aspalathi]
MSPKASTEKTHNSIHLSPPKSLPLDGYSRWSDLQDFVPFSRETLRTRELEGRFPRRQHLSQRCAVWSNRELHRYFSDPVGYRVEN